jgi:hypothetical protein
MRLYANSVSRRITDVGTFGVPDIYQERNNFVDFVYTYTFDENGKYTMRFNADNLTDNRFHWTQAGITQRSYRLGRTYSVGFGWTVF